MDQKSRGSGSAGSEGSEELLREKSEEEQAEERRPAPHCPENYCFEDGM